MSLTIIEAIDHATKYIDFINEGKEKEAEAFLKSHTDNDQFAILMILKRAIAEKKSRTTPTMREKCYECKYRRNLPGDRHSRCVNRLATAIGDEHGVRNGWFVHPFSFDPIWLMYCDGFEPEK